MNRIMGRARIVLILVLVLAIGMSVFVGEYFLKSGEWVMSSGSPHIYNAENIGCGVVSDRDGILLLDMTGNRTYAENTALRKATVHWVGDRQGNISAPALSYYAKELAGFDPVGGVYAYGGVGGQATLTLSARVQIAALEAMGDYKGTVAVYNYKTGEILCAISTPNFDPESPLGDAVQDTENYGGVYMNRFTQSTYTPGSIFKIVTAAAALECVPDIETQQFHCAGEVYYGADTVTCEQAHGTLTFREAFSKSCNCSFARIAEQVGGENLEKYAKQFGVTESIAFDGIKTASGSISAADAASVQIAWSGIGQHKDLINPCSYMSLMGAIASGGTGVAPHVVMKIETDGKVTYKSEPASTGKIMSEETANMLRSMMRDNVMLYYGDDNFPGLSVCAKSGTAEVGGGKKPNAMFTGFVMDEEYPFAFIACIEDGGYGRPVCVPVLSKVLEACRQMMDN